MDSNAHRELTFEEQVVQDLSKLCQQPKGTDASGLKPVIDDETFEKIAQCLRDIGHVDAASLPRTYAVLFMMGRLDLMPTFKAFGLTDRSLPYPDRLSLPVALRKDPDASRKFLDLQCHVISAACQIENGEGQHWALSSGDLYFESLGKLGKGGEA